MKRLAFLETQRGQVAKFEARRRRTRLMRIEQDVHSKKSMSAAEKLLFQEEVLSNLERFRHPPFRASLALELSFTVSRPNPPALHTLAKNYLDLLARPLTGLESRRAHLLYRDDRQVKVLSVHYHLREGRESVDVAASRLSDFREDLVLVQRIRTGDFRDDTDLPWHRRRIGGSAENEEDLHQNLMDAFRHFDEFEAELPALRRELAPGAVAAWRHVQLAHMQEAYLRWNEHVIRGMVSDIIRLGRQAGDAAINAAIVGMQRQFLLSDRITINAGHSPMVEGGSGAFKAGVRTALENLRASRTWLSPLRTLLSATILIVPPPNGIDLDNLARRGIVPTIHEVLQPPSTPAQLVDPEQVGDERMREYWRSRHEIERRFPRCSLTRYEVVELPRLDDDPPEGFVRIALGSGLHLDSIQGEVDRTLRQWKDSID